MRNPFLMVGAILAATFMRQRVGCRNGTELNHASPLSPMFRQTDGAWGSNALCYPMIEYEHRHNNRGKMFKRYGDAWKKR
jgi:hypothetical protein